MGSGPSRSRGIVRSGSRSSGIESSRRDRQPPRTTWASRRPRTFRSRRRTCSRGSSTSPASARSSSLPRDSSKPDGMRSELVAFVGPEDCAARAALMTLPRQRSWGSVVEDFVRHRDRNFTFDRDGRATRRHVLVRERNLVGLGKEANRIEAGRVLGQAAVERSGTSTRIRSRGARRAAYPCKPAQPPKLDLPGWLRGAWVLERLLTVYRTCRKRGLAFLEVIGGALEGKGYPAFLTPSVAPERSLASDADQATGVDFVAPALFVVVVAVNFSVCRCAGLPEHF